MLEVISREVAFTLMDFCIDMFLWLLQKIQLVFLALIVRLFFQVHSSSFNMFNMLVTVSTNLSVVLPVNKMLVSSVYMKNLMVASIFTISFMYMLNKKGPYMLLCGTPER